MHRRQRIEVGVGIGLLHGATDSWTWPLLILAGVIATAIPAGVVVSRSRTVEDDWERRHGPWNDAVVAASDNG